MQKSFVASLALSFLLAFASISYLAAPITIQLQTAGASSADVLATTTPPVPFDNLNIITLSEAGSDIVVEEVVGSMVAAPVPEVPRKVAEQRPRKQTAHPTRLIIPSIGLDTSVEAVGLNDRGEMDVPPGSSPNVGWYKHGTIPGNVGSAVIDAHVYAAFDDLRYLKVGESVIVENADGTRLEFTVDASRVYQLGELTSGMLFSRRDARRLNLITCAGSPTADGNTYTHRLVVYTKLAA